MAVDGLGDLILSIRATSSEFMSDMKAINREVREAEKAFKPLTQLVDGMGKAMTSAGKAATVGLTLPIIALGAFAVKNFNESAKAAALMENVIKTTGGAADRTAGQIRTMATALEANSIFGDDEIIQKVTNQLLTFTEVAGTAFDRATQAALDMSTMLGQDLQSSAIQVGKALNDPIAGVTALQRVGVKLTESQKDLVKSFMESGDIMGAQNVILQELEKEFGGAAAAAAKVGSGPMTVLVNKIGNLTESWGELISKAMIPFIDKATKLVEWLDSMDESTKLVILATVGLAAAVGPTLLVFGTMANGVSNMIGLFAKLSPHLGAIGSSGIVTTIANLGKNAATASVGVSSLSVAISGIAIGAAAFAIFKIAEAIKELQDAQMNLIRAQNGLSDSTIRMVEELERRGIAVDTALGGDKKYVEALQAELIASIAAEKAGGKQVAVLMDVTVATQTAAKTLAQFRIEQDKAVLALKAQEAAAEALKKAIDGMVDSVVGANNSAAVLTGAIRALTNANVPAAKIVDELGSKIRETVSTLLAQGKAVDPLLVKWADYAKAVHDAKLSLDAVAIANKVMEESLSIQGGLLATITDRISAFTSVRSALTAEELEAITNQAALDAVLAKVTDGLGDQADAMSTLGLLMNGTTEKWRELRDILGLPMPPMDVGPIDKSLAASAAKAKQQYEDAFKSIKATAVKVFSDMIQDGKLKFTSLASAIKGIFNTLWTEILSTLTAKLLTPLVTAISNSLSGALGKIPGLSSVFGGVAGPGLGALFGGGAAAAAPGFGLGGTGGVAVAGTAGAASAATIAATAGISAAVIAAIAIVKSQAHHEANTFVKTFQDPFGKAISDISNAFAAAESAGNLTIDAAEDAKVQVEKLWATFQESATAFAKGGSDEAAVVRQAFAQLGPFMQQIFSDMDKSIANLTAGSLELETATAAAALVAESLSLTQEFMAKVTEATTGSKNLEDALKALEGIGSPTAIILDRLGGDIENFFEALEKSGLPIPELIKKYHDLANVQEKVAETTAAVVQAQATRHIDDNFKTGSQISVDSAEEIREFINSLKASMGQPLNINVDGRTIAVVTQPHTFALSRNQGARVQGTR